VNTPSHAILNLAIAKGWQQGRSQGTAVDSSLYLPIALGGIVPDVPIFGFYLWMKLATTVSERQIWSDHYFRPFWQDIFAVSHSLPIAALVVAIAYGLRQKFWLALGLGWIFHSLLDLPVHHDDAHRHFFPLSNYRFVSPVSYWDPNHYGNWMSWIEIGLVLLSTLYVFSSLRSRLGRGLLIATNVFYWVAQIAMMRFS
jgi:hypothetical protein